MTPAQNALYWREWQKTRARLISDGHTKEQADAKRHALHVRALGRDKSHTAFNNRDFDAVLGVFRATYDDANLDAQLRQLDQPEERRRALINKCWEHARAFIHGENQSHTDYLCDAYMTGITKRMWGKAFYEVKDERELGQLSGILAKHASRELAKQRKAHADKVAAEERRAREEDLPF